MIEYCEYDEKDSLPHPAGKSLDSFGGVGFVLVFHGMPGLHTCHQHGPCPFAQLLLHRRQQHGQLVEVGEHLGQVALFGSGCGGGCRAATVKIHQPNVATQVAV